MKVDVSLISFMIAQYQEICSLRPEGEKHRHYYKGKIDVLMDMLRGSYEERGV